MTARLHAYFSYRDAPAALRWLERAFGFETILEVPDEAGGILHAELRLGDVVIIVFSDDAGYGRMALKGVTTGHGTYVAVPDNAAVDAVHASAASAGAKVIWEPEANAWSYRCRVLDPEGYEWTFGTWRPAA